MRRVIRGLAIILAGVLAPLAFVTLVSPGVSNADCGFGAVYDALSLSPLGKRKSRWMAMRSLCAKRVSVVVAALGPFLSGP